MTTAKTRTLTLGTFVSKVTFLLFNTQSRFVIAFLPRRKHLLISLLQSLSAVILETTKRKSLISIHFPLYLPWSYGMDAMILAFVVLNFKSAFSFLSFTFIRSSLILHFLTLEWYHQHIWGCWYFSWQSWFQLMICQAQHFIWCALHRS